jgi:type II secretory pathway component GspD/PulD (secretin)
MTRFYGMKTVLIAMVGCACLPAHGQNDTSSISPGDLLYVDVYRRPELSTTQQVDADGNINVPYVGKVNVAGKSDREASAVVATALQRILKNPRVTIARGSIGMAGGFRTEEMITELVPLENSSAENLSNALQGMSSEGGAVSFDPDTNTLILTDSPNTIQNMMSVIGQLDKMQDQRTQVRIEGKIAEVKVGAMKELGVRWWVQETQMGGGYYPMPGQDVGINALKGGTAAPINNESVGGVRTNTTGIGSTTSRRFVNEPSFDRRLNVPVQIPKAGQMFFGLLNENIDLGVLLDALVADDKAELLAAPNILTVNHQEAEIVSQEEFPYTEFGTEITGRTTTSVKFLDLGIKMSVVPHVHSDSGGTYVKLELEPEVSFPTGSSDGVPIRSVRSFKGTASVRDGQTLVIGGIYRNDMRNVEQRVPGLGSIPGIGRLFRHTEKSQSQTELMVFVTPTVHESPETVTWDRMLDITKASEIVGPAVMPSIGVQPETREE